MVAARQGERSLGGRFMRSANSKRGPAPHNLASAFRGTYARVANRLHVDASYVSRVARGQRKSKKIETALEEEMWSVLKELKMKYSEFGIRRANRKTLHKIGIGRVVKRKG
jgi:hypothetical protein